MSAFGWCRYLCRPFCTSPVTIGLHLRRPTWWIAASLRAAILHANEFHLWRPRRDLQFFLAVCQQSAEVLVFRDRGVGKPRLVPIKAAAGWVGAFGAGLRHKGIHRFAQA